eukprot:PhF_6_TR40487/c0_g1_i1/m.60554
MTEFLLARVLAVFVLPLIMLGSKVEADKKVVCILDPKIPSVTLNVYIGTLHVYEEAIQRGFQLRFISGATALDLVRGIYDASNTDCSIYVGPGQSTLSLQIQPSIPRLQVEFLASTTDLQNKDAYPYFSRMNPDATDQGKVLLDLVTHFGWTNFMIVTQVDAFSASASAYVEGIARQAGITTTNVILPFSASEIGSLPTSMSLIEASPARIVLVFANVGSPIYLSILQAMAERGLMKTRVVIAISTFCNLDLSPVLGRLADGMLCARVGSLPFFTATTERGRNVKDFPQTEIQRLMAAGGSNLQLLNPNVTNSFSPYAADALRFALSVVDQAVASNVDYFDLASMYNIVKKTNLTEGSCTGDYIAVNTTTNKRLGSIMQIVQMTTSGVWNPIGTWYGSLVKWSAPVNWTVVTGSHITIPSTYVDLAIDVNKSNADWTTPVLIAVGVCVGTLGVVSIFFFRHQRKLNKLLHDDIIATELAESVAMMNFEKVSYLQTITNPTRIQKAFIRIVDELVFMKSYIPPALFATQQPGSQDDDEDTNAGSRTFVTSNVLGTSELQPDAPFEMSSLQQAIVEKISASSSSMDRLVLPINNICVISLRLLPFNVIQLSDDLVRKHTETLEVITRTTAKHCGVPMNFFGDSLLVTFNAVRRCGMKTYHAGSVMVLIRKAIQSRCRELLPVAMGASVGDAQCGDLGAAEMRAFCVRGECVEESRFLCEYASKTLGWKDDDDVVTPLPYISGYMYGDSLSDFHIQVKDFFDGPTRRRMYNPPVKPPKFVAIEVLGMVEGENDEWMYTLENKQMFFDYNECAMAMALRVPDVQVNVENFLLKYHEGKYENLIKDLGRLQTLMKD